MVPSSQNEAVQRCTLTAEIKKKTVMVGPAELKFATGHLKPTQWQAILKGRDISASKRNAKGQPQTGAQSPRCQYANANVHCHSLAPFAACSGPRRGPMPNGRVPVPGGDPHLKNAHMKTKAYIRNHIKHYERIPCSDGAQNYRAQTQHKAGHQFRCEHLHQVKSLRPLLTAANGPREGTGVENDV